MASPIIRACEPLLCCDEIWEQAYLQFETADEEITKFRNRLRRLGANHWSRDAQIVEIFCGRGNGLKALAELGFTSVEGVDLSERLLLQYEGNATLYVADCRKLPFADASRDIVIVQGGLHHLPELPKDLEEVLREVRRVLRPGGRFVIVEPWLTPFLRAVHFVAEQKVLRRISKKMSAFGTMVERERTTYFAWLRIPGIIRTALDSTFRRERAKAHFGKLEYVGICE